MLPIWNASTMSMHESTRLCRARRRISTSYLAALKGDKTITMDVPSCRKSLENALVIGAPEIFKMDQSSQFTSLVITGRLEEQGIKISKYGHGRAFDSIFVKQLWRSVNHEEIYLKGYQTVPEHPNGLRECFNFITASVCIRRLAGSRRKVNTSLIGSPKQLKPDRDGTDSAVRLKEQSGGFIPDMLLCKLT
jgi:hypothetical protein